MRNKERGIRNGGLRAGSSDEAAAPSMPWPIYGKVDQARSTGLEPATQGLEIPCSMQLSYERFSPVFYPVG